MRMQEMRRESPRLPARTETTVVADMAQLAGLVRPQAPPRWRGATGATGPAWKVGAGLGGLVVKGSF